MPKGIKNQIADILGRVGRIEVGLLTADAELSGLGLDSVAMVEVIFAIEETFDISIPYASDTAPVTFGSLVGLVPDLVKDRP
jgi:acyl carrier protein